VNLIYLAQPYSGDGQEGMDERHKKGQYATIRLLNAGNNVFSPIVHCHPLSQLPDTWDYWENIDMDFIKRCDILGVLCLPGWEFSIGVTAEIKYANELGIPIIYLPAELGDEIQEQTGKN